MVPVGPLAPDSVAVSLIEPPMVTGPAVALVVRPVQFVRVTGCGRMKSFSSSVKVLDERLFR